MTQPAGWYDDPQDQSQLRYWDGALWSSHVTAKAARPMFDQAIGGQSIAQVGHPKMGYASHPSATPDGVPLAGWGLRAVARLMDGLFAFLLALPLTGWLFYLYVTGLMDWASVLAQEAAAGGPPPVTPSFPPLGVLGSAFAAGLIGLIVNGAYEVFFLRRSGATPGKKIMGISVRLRDRAGPPPMKAILGRTGFILGMSLLGASLLDDLWPLWDEKKQALHDMVVGTNVVVGPQPRQHGSAATSPAAEVLTDA